MKNGKDGLLLTIHGAMEFIWRYAWAGFATIAMFHHYFPLFGAFVVYVLGALVTFMSRGRGWRIIYIIGLQAAAFVLAAGIAIHAFYYKTVPLWSQEWIREFFTCQRQSLEWIMLFVFFFWVLLFWIGGVLLIRKPPRYYTVCSRFDLGIAAFFVLYLIEWLLLVKGGIQTPDPIARLLIFPYFCCSIFAIGLARNLDNEQSEYLTGYRGIGMISTILVVLALIVTALFMFLLPILTVVAEIGYAALKEVAEPMGPVLVNIIRFLFLGRRQSCCGPSGSDNGGSSPGPDIAGESSWWEDVLMRVMEWGFFGLLGVIAFGITVFCLWHLVRWLLVRTALVEKDKGSGSLISWWVERIKTFLRFCRTRILGRGKGGRRIAPLYAGLLAWGRHSGMQRSLSETPGEYGVRLKGQFPLLEKEIGLIIELYHKEVYEERDVTEAQFVSARSVWRRLRSPLNWPSRFRSWLFRPGITTAPGG
ncbi:MAG TPA: DUF4129 domain-containing protein [Syntrophales bacterium]|nr:DUF4129 domain-containing protein [Syntrophales bacterium]HPQ45717.1 DUF4129 domain-containing protein [Syntrophales bacterium]